MKPRPEADLLDEVLTTVRSLQRDVARLTRQIERSTGAPSGENPSLKEKQFYKDVSRLLVRDLKVSGLSGAPLENEGIRVSLMDDGPVVPESTVNELQNLAERYGRSIVIQAASGAPISFIADGREIEVPELEVDPLI